MWALSVVSNHKTNMKFYNNPVNTQEVTQEPPLHIRLNERKLRSRPRLWGNI